MPCSNRESAVSLAVREEPAQLLLKERSFVAGPENRLLAAVVNGWSDALACDALTCDKAKGNKTKGDKRLLLDHAAWRRLASPLLLVGATGSGKSHLADGLAQQLDESLVHHSTANDLRRGFADAIGSGNGNRLAQRDC